MHGNMPLSSKLFYAMKKELHRLLLLFYVTGISFTSLAFNSSLIVERSQEYAHVFELAYKRNPLIPKGLIEAVAFSYTRLQHHEYNSDSPESCIGLPRTYSIMGLTENGKGFFKNNLKYVSVLSGYSKDELKRSPEKSILGYASAFTALLTKKQSNNYHWDNYVAVLKALSELPSNTLQQDYALNSQIYVMLWFLRQPGMQTAFNFPDYNIDMAAIFGEANYKVLSSRRVNITTDCIEDELGQSYAKMPGPCSDFPGSIWVAADASNYSSRSGTAISAITIHDIEGTYAGAISWFQNPIANVSSHYCLRSIDGQVTQMVCETDKAWHVGTENPYTIGLEHEGKADYEGWYTEAMYQSSADVCLDAMIDYGIDPLRTHEGPPEYGIRTLGNCIKLKGHQHFANSTHRDPGLNWDWEYFYRLLNDGTTPSPVPYTSLSGTIYDSGGASGNYNDDERKYWLIAPTGATSVTLNFTQFDLELDWDYLYIYDGTTNHDDLIGVYTGTISPGVVVAESGAILLEFRSDCATTKPGWTASYTSSNTPLSCPVPTGLNESSIIPVSASLNWTGSSAANAYLLRYRDHTYTSWNYEVINGTSKVLTGLAANSEYYWGVAALCGTDTSSFAGHFFTTPSAENSFSIDQCDGTFRDSGGPSGIYLNNEDYTYTITGSGPITVSFSSFNIEASWDFLYIHDGTNTLAPQVVGSPFTGTGSPGTITSTGNSITFRFTSDSRTNEDGWEAIWSCSPSGPPEPAAAFTTSGNTLCSNDSLHFINTSTDATSYQWNIPGGIPSTSTDIDPWIQFTSSGAYPVELIASGTGGNDTIIQIINVIVYPKATAAAIPNNSTLFLPSAIVTFTNVSTNATSYFWDFGDGNTSTDTNPWNAYSTAGNYSVMLIAMNDQCANDTTFIAIDVLNPLGVEEYDLISNIHPNPASASFLVTITSLTNGQCDFTFYDIAGKLVYSRTIDLDTGTNRIRFNRSELKLSAGHYLMRVSNAKTTSLNSIILK